MTPKTIAIEHSSGEKLCEHGLGEKLYEQGSGEQKPGEEISTEQKSGKDISIINQVNNVKQNIDKQQNLCLKVNCHNSKDMLRKQSNLSFSKELETKDRPLRKEPPNFNQPIANYKQLIVEHKLKNP